MNWRYISCLVTLVVVMSGCAATGSDQDPKGTVLVAKKMFKDSEGPQPYARIRLVNVGVQILSIDRQKIGPIVNLAAGSLIHEAHVKPGARIVLLRALRDNNANNAASTWQEALKEFTLDAKANHVYSFMAVPMGDIARFSFKDYGSAYDETCGHIFNLKQDALTNWTKIHTNGKLPTECY